IVVLMGQAKTAMGRNDLTAAEQAIVAAEKIDAKAPTVVAARADLDKQKASMANAGRIAPLVTQARAALGRKDLAGAETAVVEAEKIDAKAPTVVAVRADLNAAKTAADQQAAATKVRDLL